MEVEARSDGNRAVLTLKGDVTNTGDLDVLDETVNDLLRRGVRHVTLNMDAVPCADSAALGRILQLYSTVNQAGGDLKLAGLHERLKRLLCLDRLSEHAEKKPFLDMPKPFGTTLPSLTPMICLALLAVLALLVAIASRVSF